MNWEKRYREAESAFQRLKTITKKFDYTKEELAEAVHTLGRGVFYVETPPRFWCKIGIHCYHNIGKRDRIEQHGPYYPKQLVFSREYEQCCYCGKERPEPPLMEYC